MKSLKHMESEGLIEKSRTSYRHKESKPFIGEALYARRARIEREGKTLNIWVSLRSKRMLPARFSRGALYLIEDFRGRDEYPRTLSGYSGLWLLADELEWVATPLADPIEQLRQQDRKMEQFASDPVGSLKSIGAEFGPERHIHAIYRFRAVCIEMVNSSRTTIGYPLIIREA